MKIKLLTLLALCTVLSFSGCKEEPSQIPTVPTTFSLEDGAVVEELNVELSASGSTVEDNGLNVSYVYYIGKSADALEKTSTEVTLDPYTQYFWCAQAKTEAGKGEKTEVRTFYCVPPIELTSDNGDGEWAAVIRCEKDGFYYYNLPVEARKEVAEDEAYDENKYKTASLFDAVVLSESADVTVYQESVLATDSYELGKTVDVEIIRGLFEKVNE